MQEIVVIDGEITLENVLDGEVELEAITDLDPEVVLSTGGAVYPHYDGSYTVTPSASVQTLDTSDKVMDDDVTVNPIPSEYIVPTGTKTITQNGTHDVAQYESAVVDVQGGITPTGTKQIAIASNGTVTEDVTSYANAEINVNVPASAVDAGTKNINSNGTHDVVGFANASVNVPNSYSASDEGKVVSNGALVAQTSDTVTANDTYDTTLINSLTVNVSGGGKVTKTLTNILGNSTTLVKGYLANNGSISSQGSATKEVTTDYIDISAYQGQSIYFFEKTGDSVIPWIGYFFYTSAQATIGSRGIPFGNHSANGFGNANCAICYQGSAIGSLGSSAPVTIPSTAEYVRVSFRTGGAGALSAVLASEIDPADYWSREIDELAFVNQIESDGNPA